MPARIAMIAMTTSSSMSVKAPTLYLRNTLFMIVLSVIGLRFAHSKRSIRSVNAFSESFLSSAGATFFVDQNYRISEVFAHFRFRQGGRCVNFSRVLRETDTSHRTGALNRACGARD